jgi:hypothetical protein
MPQATRLSCPLLLDPAAGVIKTMLIGRLHRDKLMVVLSGTRWGKKWRRDSHRCGTGEQGSDVRDPLKAARGQRGELAGHETTPRPRPAIFSNETA